jgi:hypothetical protein
MINCHEMRRGDVLFCEECGLELQVVNECMEAGKEVQDCGCHSINSACTFTCCGHALKKK